MSESGEPFESPTAQVEFEVTTSATTSTSSQISTISPVRTKMSLSEQLLQSDFKAQITAQLGRFERMQRVYSSVCDAVDPDIDALTVKRDYIQTIWTECCAAHPHIAMAATKKDEDHTYFTEDQFSSTELTYLDMMGAMSSKIKTVSPERPARSSGLMSRESGTSFLTQSSQRNITKFPRIEIPRFSGRYDSWASFKDFFETLILKEESLSNFERLHYLKSSVEGEAAKLIKHLSISEANFQVAWQLLESRYSNKRCIINAHLQTLFETPKMDRELASSIQELHDRALESTSALKALSRPVDQWSDLLVYLIVSKLDPETRRAWELSVNNNIEYPTFKELCSFLLSRARALETLPVQPVEGQSSPAKINKSKTKNINAKSNVKTHVTDVNVKKCTACTGNHALPQCQRFKGYDVSKRFEFVKKHKLCTNCLGTHKWNDFTSKYVCSSCSQKHHSLLHRQPKSNDNDNKSNQNEKMSNDNEIDTSDSSTSAEVHLASVPAVKASSVLLATAMVTVTSAAGRSQQVRALIDQGSTWTLASETLIQALKAPRTKVSTTVSGIGGTNAGTVRHAASIVLTPVGTEQPSVPVNALVLKSLTSYRPDAQCPLRSWPHLRGLKLADEDLSSSKPIQLVIGADLYSAIMLNGLVKGNRDQPIAQRTIFGWIVTGWTAKVASQAPSQSVAMLCHELADLQNELRRFWEVEEVINIDKPLSQDELICEEHFLKTHKRLSNGRYSDRLPFKVDPSLHLGSSKGYAEKVFAQLERKLNRNPGDRLAYHAFMRDYEQQDHIERVPHEVSNSSRPLVYLPHHAVKKEDSTTTKLRVVFNASNPTSSSLSLNDVLLPGRKLQNDLSQVLLQWRMFKYVFTADIAQMYRQIRIQSEDRDFQRLVWRYDPREPVEDFRLTTVTFGVNCSPYLALRVIAQHAIDEGKEYPLAAPVLNSELYVDDVLFGADDLVMAKQIREQLTTLLLSGGFHLRKWASNSVDLLNEIDPSDHGLACEKPLSEGAGIKILGIYWNPLQDSFQFTVNSDTRAATTKRIMLSVIAKIYDPLGWVSPLII